MVALDQLGERLERARRNVAVVLGEHGDLAPVDAAGGVDLGGGDPRAERKAAADEAGGAAHDVDVADEDLGVGDAGVGGERGR